MRLEKRRHVLVVKERGSLKPSELVSIDAFTPSEAKKKAEDLYPNCNILVADSH